MKRINLFCATALLVVTLFITGCTRIALYQNLSEDDANEIMVLLAEHGIKAHKKREIRQNEIFFAIEVPDKDMVRARALLVKHNLPKRREPGLLGVYKEKGLIPTPDEQKARYILALKGEIINSIRRIPQVVDADVVLNVPTQDEFATSETQHLRRPTASAVIRVKPDDSGLAPITEAKMQQFIANSVEGLNPRDVAIMITYVTVPGRTRPGDVKALPTDPALPAPAFAPAVEHKIAGLTLDAESRDKLKIYILLFFLVLVILSVALIVVIVQGARMRRTLEALGGPAGRSPAIEGEVMEEGPPRLDEGRPEDEF